MDKIVVHGNDGKIVKGHSSDFSANRSFFHLVTLQRPFDSEKIWLGNQKAVFFVRDFTGNPTHIDLHNWATAPNAGKSIVVSFRDGERLYGTAESIPTDHTGFFVVPIDPFSNTKKAYVVNTFIDSVQIID